MKVIDFERKGNIVRYYFGADDCQDYWGDDWDDAPYDCNAGTVYERYVQAVIDIAYPFEWAVLEPCDGVQNCQFSKEDMKNRKTPCIVVCKDPEWYVWRFSDEVGNDNNIRVYFGDNTKDSWNDIERMLDGKVIGMRIRVEGEIR